MHVSQQCKVCSEVCISEFSDATYITLPNLEKTILVWASYSLIVYPTLLGSPLAIMLVDAHDCFSLLFDYLFLTKVLSYSHVIPTLHVIRLSPWRSKAKSGTKVVRVTRKESHFIPFFSSSIRRQDRRVLLLLLSVHENKLISDAAKEEHMEKLSTQVAC